MTNSEQVQVCDESVLTIVDLFLVSMWIALESVIGEVCRCQLQNCITVSLKGLVAALGGMDRTRRGRPQDKLGVDVLSDASD